MATGNAATAGNAGAAGTAKGQPGAPAKLASWALPESASPVLPDSRAADLARPEPRANLGPPAMMARKGARQPWHGGKSRHCDQPGR